MKLKNFIPLTMLLVLLLMFFLLGGHRWINLEFLKTHHLDLLNWIDSHRYNAMLVYCALYIALVAISFPGASFLTLIGGYFFGLLEGTLLVVSSATLGAILVFAAVKFAIGESLIKRAAGWTAKMRKGFEEDAFSYLMILRLVPIFPFWVVNIVPALLNVSFRIFCITTFLGIIPGSFVYVSVGVGLGRIIEESEHLNLHILYEPKILLPLIGLCLLSFIPVIYKKLKKRT